MAAFHGADSEPLPLGHHRTLDSCRACFWSEESSVVVCSPGELEGYVLCRKTLLSVTEFQNAGNRVGLLHSFG